MVLLQQYEEQLSDFKKELGDIRNTLFALDLEDSDGLNVLQIAVEQTVFDRTLDVKKSLLAHSSRAPTLSSDAKGVRLPKIGNLLHWNTFWEQFEVSVHSKSGLPDAKKLVYLQHALKGGSAKQSIEGLSKSGDHYTEAVEGLKDRYNRPWLIHQAHVWAIVDAPALKEGTGKELRRLHEVVQQHLVPRTRPPWSVTSYLELKFDVTTMFEWQRHSQSSTDVPHYDDLLKFLNLRAQASESSTSESSRKSTKQEVPQGRPSSKQVTSFATSTLLM